MDNKAYLNQIASEARGTKQPVRLFNFSPKLTIFIIGAVILTLVIFIVGIFLSGNKSTSDQELATQLNTRTTNLIDTINNYNKQLKSPDLRSIASSINSLLTEVDSNLKTSAKQDFSNKLDKKATDQIKAAEKDHLAKFTEELENGRLNGILDRTFVNEVSNQLSIVIVMENDLILKTKKQNIKDYLQKSIDNLSIVKDDLDNYTNFAN